MKTDIVGTPEGIGTKELHIGSVIYRCLQDITDIYGYTIFTEGLVYEKVKPNSYHMMLVDNKVEESEVSTFSELFTCI